MKCCSYYYWKLCILTRRKFCIEWCIGDHPIPQITYANAKNKKNNTWKLFCGYECKILPHFIKGFFKENWLYFKIGFDHPSQMTFFDFAGPVVNFFAKQ